MVKPAEKQPPMNVLQLSGDPMAVAKQQINNERIKNENKHLVKNRTNDFVQNPMSRKSPTILPFSLCSPLYS